MTIQSPTLPAWQDYQVRLPGTLHRQLRLLALDRRVSASTIVVEALRQYLGVGQDATREDGDRD